MSVLHLQGIRRSYRPGIEVLHGVDLEADAGEIVGLIGRNGAGKTTLLRIALGMLEPHDGTVRLFGKDPRRHPVETRRRLGYVSEDQMLPGSLTVGDTVGMHRGLFPRWNEALERDLLDRFELPWRSSIKNLSKGQARQVALLCALCHYPELLILDEPAGGLDPVARREFLETSIAALGEEGTTILFSSHQMGDVERMAGRIVLLDAGEKMLDSDLDDVREEHSMVFVPEDCAGIAADRLRRVPGCRRVRARPGGWNALFEGTPAEVRARLQERELAEFEPRQLPLEELFIELVGGDR